MKERTNMNNFYKRILSLTVIVMITVFLSTTALAGGGGGGGTIPAGVNPVAYVQAQQMVAAQTSSYDVSYGIAQAVADAKLAYAAAQQNGDASGMAAAHAAAEAARAQAGNYSGGVDGSQYIALPYPGYIYPPYIGYPYPGGYPIVTTFTVAASANEGGSISPSGVASVGSGGSQGYTITPSVGYKISDVVVDGASVGAVPGYTFNNVTTNHAITAAFAQLTYGITASASPGGSISPSGLISVTHGSGQSYAITAHTGYRISNVYIDGTSVGAVSSYIFSNVTTNHAINATFERLAYSITATASTGGSVNPNGLTTVYYGDSRNYVITASSGYMIDTARIDGVSVGAVTTYTFSNVKGNHTISATFKPSGHVDIGSTSLYDNNGTSLSGRTIKSGYGVFAKVIASYGDVNGVSVTAQYNFDSGWKTVTLTETSSGVFEFPINSGSTQHNRCIYIPAATPDGAYQITFTITAKNVEGTTLTSTKTETVTIKGDMYEDDFTGDS
jgi:hypothetical protein